jgi:hypothetical protein
MKPCWKSGGRLEIIRNDFLEKKYYPGFARKCTKMNDSEKNNVTGKHDTQLGVFQEPL